MLLAYQLLEKPGSKEALAKVDPTLAPRIEALAELIESLAASLEDASATLA